MENEDEQFLEFENQVNNLTETAAEIKTRKKWLNLTKFLVLFLWGLLLVLGFPPHWVVILFILLALFFYLLAGYGYKILLDWQVTYPDFCREAQKIYQQQKAGTPPSEPVVFENRLLLVLKQKKSRNRYADEEILRTGAQHFLELTAYKVSLGNFFLILGGIVFFVLRELS